MGRGKKSPPFAMVPVEMLKSEAFRDLTPSAGKALPVFIYKAGEVHCINPRDVTWTRAVFSLTYTEAEKWGITRPTFFRTLESLVACGFIDPVEKGGRRGDGMSCSKFRHSDRWRDYGKPKFKEIRWKGFIN